MDTRSLVADRPVLVTMGHISLEGEMRLPPGSLRMVVFAHGSGSSRKSPRNRAVARRLQEADLGTLLFDLLTPEEEHDEAGTAHLRFDIGLLSERLTGALDWLLRTLPTQKMVLGCFGASTGAAAALVAAAQRPDVVRAVVSRGGRPDLAGEALRQVRAPSLFIVGSEDHAVQRLNREALDELRVPDKRLALVPGATHLFEEPGALDEVARLASEWFTQHLVTAGAAAGAA